jgi:hypothetical protein
MVNFANQITRINKKVVFSTFFFYLLVYVLFGYAKDIVVSMRLYEYVREEEGTIGR